MQKIVPHLWFDTQAVEAAEFYATVFPNSKVKSKHVIKNTPSGDCDFVIFDVMGFEFQAISAGPYFKLNPSISFMINFDPSSDSDASQTLQNVWDKLLDGGKVLMPLSEYPFSKKYGWLQDKFGVSWQLILTNPEGEPRPEVMPYFMFTKEMSGKAKEATDNYINIFKNSKRGGLQLFGPGMEPSKEGDVMFTDFMLENIWFVALDAGTMHDFTFSEAVSLIVNCENQEEIDYYTDKLSAVPDAEQCGWIKDKYGVSFQIVPYAMQVLMESGDQEKVDRMVQAMLKMKRLNIQELEDAAK